MNRHWKMYIRCCLSTCPHSSSQHCSPSSRSPFVLELHNVPPLLYSIARQKWESPRERVADFHDSISSRAISRRRRGKSGREREEDARGYAGARPRSRGGTRVDELSARAENGQAARRAGCVTVLRNPWPPRARGRFAKFERTFGHDAMRRDTSP